MPDTTFARAHVNTYVDLRDNGSLTLVNRKWATLFQEGAQVTVFFAEWQPTEFYRQRPRGPQRVYSRRMLTKARLDSLVCNHLPAAIGNACIAATASLS